MIQGSQEWIEARLGRVTASRISDIVSKTKSGWGASRSNYMAQLIVERLTRQQAESYSNAAMVWGVNTEPQARSAYEFMTNYEVREVGFVEHPFIKMSGASPDGYVGDNGLIEIKCPSSATHLEALLGAPIEKKYLCQMQWQMTCTSAGYCDFVSFDPRFNPELQIKIQRIERDENFIKELEDQVIEFLGELDAKLEKLRAIS